MIDDDLGRSGSGIARPGFEKLLAAICEGRVGAVLSIEASRLARNGRDWHTLLEFCGLVDTLIVDEDGIYNPRQPNDRLLLGMKGTMSEMELSSVPPALNRSHQAEGPDAASSSGLVAVGYLKTDDDRIEKDPDRRVQDAIALVFHKFVELQSVRQVLVWMTREKLLIPAVVHSLGKRVNRVEVTGVPRAPSHPDEPGLCRRLRLRPAPIHSEDREWAQEDHSQTASQLEGLGCFDQEPPRGIYLVGRV